MRFMKIKYDGEKVRLEWETERKRIRQDGSEATDRTQHKLVSDDQPEDGFTRALDAFREVVLRILELPDAYGEGLSVRGVSLSYTDEDRMGCVVTCLKELAATDAPLVLNTPHLMELDLDNPEQAAMPAEMEEAIEALCEAAERYVEGHRAQGDLFAGAEEVAGQRELVGAGAE